MPFFPSLCVRVPFHAFVFCFLHLPHTAASPPPALLTGVHFSVYTFSRAQTPVAQHIIYIYSRLFFVGDSEIYAHVQKELRVSKHVTCPRYPRKRPKGTKRGGCGDGSGGTSLLLSSQTLGADASRMLLNQTGFPDIDPHFCVQNHCWGGGGSPTPVSTVRPTPTHPARQKGAPGRRRSDPRPPGGQWNPPAFQRVVFIFPSPVLCVNGKSRVKWGRSDGRGGRHPRWL